MNPNYYGFPKEFVEIKSKARHQWEQYMLNTYSSTSSRNNGEIKSKVLSLIAFKVVCAIDLRVS